MGLKLTQKRHEELYEKMAQRIREMIEPRSLAQRIYPKLKTSAEDEQPKRRAPIDGWGHLRPK
jgi:hypothetical protein